MGSIISLHAMIRQLSSNLLKPSFDNCREFLYCICEKMKAPEDKEYIVTDLCNLGKSVLDSIDFEGSAQVQDLSLSFKLVDGMTKTLMTSEITYIERSGRHIIFHTENDEYESCSRESVSSIERSLSEIGFARCNSGFVVNLSKCDGIYREYVLVNKVKIPISRKLKKNFMDSVTKHFKSI